MNIHTSKYTPPPHTGLDIVYQDEDLLVLNKPAGLLSVPGRGEEKQDSLATRVQAEYPKARIVHRLDMATSGLLLMAAHEKMQREFSMMFEQRQILKRYIAVVEGKPEHESGEINLPLITDWPNRPRQMVDHDIGKPALTLYKVLEFDAALNTTRIELKPLTGRTHQLRVHMQALGHTILGDRLYATERVYQKAPRLLLHAVNLEFEHPVTKKILSLESKPEF